MKLYQGIPRYRTDELVAMETQAVGQADDLKWVSEDGRTRLWLSRCGVADGEPVEHTVTVERQNPRGRLSSPDWYELYRYNGDRTSQVLS